MITKSLNDCLILTIDKRGVTPKKLSSDWCSSGYRVLSANNVKTSGLKSLEDIRFVDKETYQKWMKEEIQRGDVLLTSEAPAGEVFYWDSDEKIVVGQRLFGLRTKNDVDPLYLKYFLQSTAGQAEISNKCSGSTVFGISAKMFDQIKVILPESISYQKRVSSFLYAIDKKIENNNKINAELESLAKTIYDYWFLQFEFPNEEGKPYKSSGGKMVWNEELKREIPEGWKVSNIKNYCEITDCLHSKKPDFCFENEDCYLLSLENLTKEGHIDLTNKYYIKSKDYKEWIKRIEIKENDFVVTNAGRAGDICKVPRNVKCAIGRNITAIRPFNIDPNYLYCFFKSIYVKEQIQSNLDCGSFFMSFNVKSIKKINLLIPTNDVLNKIDLLLQPIIKQIEMNIQENNRLSSLRDFLLPMLMNGQVRFIGNE